MSGSYSTPPPSIAIVGGRLAGLAAAEAASRFAGRVVLFEARGHCGGRAGSLVDATTGQTIDACQHVALGCCTQVLEFLGRLGLAEAAFCRHRTLHFFDPAGRRYDLAPAGWLPAPLHHLPGLLRLGFLTFAERLAIVRTLPRLVRARVACAPENEPDVGTWLRAHGQSERAMERFWGVILASALGETPDRIALSAAQHVFREGFFAARSASDLLVPQMPLATLCATAAARLAQRGVELRMRVRVRQIAALDGRVQGVVLPDGSCEPFARVILAVTWQQAAALIPAALRPQLPELDAARGLPAGAITAVHLWYDRPITSLPHAVLVGTLSQWLFADPAPAAEPYHYQVVISAAHALANLPRETLARRVATELAAVFPVARAARLVHERVIAQPAAVFVCRPGVARLRPAQRTPLANLACAGDWTATGWPATMEGAVRSGYRAVEALRDDGSQCAPLPVNTTP